MFTLRRAIVIRCHGEGFTMVVNFLHACDASAAVLIDGTPFFAAASDEGSVLRVYDLNHPGPPVATTDVTAFLEPDDPEETEADIEGAAQIGERIYWIGSHGRSRKGKERKIRQRLFATTMSKRDGVVRLQPAGTPCKSLLAALTSAPDLARFNLAAAAQKKPEEAGGLNLEGLAPTPEGHLLIGFRNPIPGGVALVARLRNPGALVDGSAAAPDIGLAGTLDLGGRGLRALEFVASLRLYLVLAGPFGDGDDFRLYKWSGDPAVTATPLSVDFNGLHPEELIVTAQGDGHTVRFFSDDGTDACKEAAPDARRFRSATAHVEL
jgi:hypothetical protein